jgi:serine/threonine protein kinase
MDFLRNLFGNAKFNLGQRLGAGGFGTVYRGTYQGLEVAIKKIQIDRLTAERLGREHEAMQKLEHSNVLKLIHWEDSNEFR